ncbi:MAG TPA: hypothetical protein VHM90_21090 [Phycisphaerae bacterium]|jgi:hypothetical protein|nr:hypothetical protein [Phycisphaerae bacterium]
MSWDSCEPDEHFLTGTLAITVKRKRGNASLKGIELLVGITEGDVTHCTCKTRRVVTNAQGQCLLEFPIGKAVVGTKSRVLDTAWIALDRETEVEIWV